MIEIPVLHRVIGEDNGRIGPRALYTVTPDELTTYLELRKDWRTKTRLQKKREKDNFFLLTFDDGYYNNLTEAIPLLESFAAQAIIFVTTGFIEGRVYPYEFELASVIEHHNSLCIESGVSPAKVESLEAKESLYRRLRRPLKAEPYQVRNAFLDRLADLNCYDRERFQDELFLSWEDIVELDRHPLVTIGAHTETHPVLTRRFPWVAYREMKRSKCKLESVLGHDVQYFSYPYGRNNAVVRTLGRWAGFRWAFTTEDRCIEDFDACDPMAIPRMDIQHLV